ncbi:hypothetical protein GYMLUDRAFT_245624 [Collybiopsis luxurians FD-317 M1]|uniref:Unplaced genomic scaffold GYMLUscaffold_33, whole genome shotgun sequence n=1 Tax=Collybiopsis luxurians FD-317 M1 TaxID=944289 RepID=A0A0D0BUN7_9AGAR|nr:hypothetical protein GYMLUDRAFT_245624 [Collybiopsis luxurians FD-317 M1]
MALTLSKLAVQILTENIIPVVLGPILWMIMPALVLSLILHYTWFPCLSLQTLDAKIKDVVSLLEGYEQNIRSQCLSDAIDYDQHKRLYKNFEGRLLRIKRVAHKRSDQDYKVATWKKYISFSRAAMLSSSYKKLLKLKTDVEHYNVLVLKGQNNHLLKMTHLYHRNVSSSPEENI